MLTRREFLATAACTVARAGAPLLTRRAKTRSGLPSPFPAKRLALICPLALSAATRCSNSRTRLSFAAQNSGLIREFKALSSTGVSALGQHQRVRLLETWSLDSPEPEHPQVREVTGEPKARYTR